MIVKKTGDFRNVTFTENADDFVENLCLSVVDKFFKPNTGIYRFEHGDEVNEFLSSIGHIMKYVNLSK